MSSHSFCDSGGGGASGVWLEAAPVSFRDADRRFVLRADVMAAFSRGGATQVSTAGG